MLTFRRVQPEQHLTPNEAAAWWFARLDSPDMRASDHRRFEAWRLASLENEAAFVRAEVLWRASKAAAADPVIMSLRAAALDATQTSKHKKMSPVLSAAAAVLLLVMGGAVTVAVSGRLPDSLNAISNHTPDHGQFVTAVGERSTVTLRDGSVITLDTDSTVRVAYSDSERLVVLSHGQALFEVAHNNARPFVVQAGDRRIVATGTAFDVRLDSQGVAVTLLEGHVIVDQMAAQGEIHAARAELQPGERLVAKRDTPVMVTNANINGVTSWRSGQLVFLDARLADAAAEINRYTHTPVVVVDDAANLRVNGVFRTGQPAEFAKAVAEIYGLDVKPSSGDIRLDRR